MDEAKPVVGEDTLRRFREKNPEAKVEAQDGVLTVLDPWGDETLALRVPHEAGELMAALNAVRLPPRYSALWHENGDLEFIFAPLTPSHEAIGRSFQFRFGGKEYVCEYAECSRELIFIANASRPKAPPTQTAHRNLLNIRAFNRFLRSQPDATHENRVTVISFWIRSLQEDEGELDRLLRHLNFFMSYFDRNAPRILIHEEPPSEPGERALRYPFGDYPGIIAGRQVDPYMLTLWEGAQDAPDPFRRFLYGYQVLEYAAFYHLREEVRAVVRRAVAAPDAPARVDDVVRTVLEAVADERTADEAKITQVIQQAVDPGFVWLDIHANEDFFSTEKTFDGGFTVPPLIKKGWNLEDFRAAWIPKLPDALRKIRNALVHAREQRQTRCISPSVANQHLLRPWAVLVDAVASQVMLYRVGE